MQNSDHHWDHVYKLVEKNGRPPPAISAPSSTQTLAMAGLGFNLAIREAMRPIAPLTRLLCFHNDHPTRDHGGARREGDVAAGVLAEEPVQHWQHGRHPWLLRSPPLRSRYRHAPHPGFLHWTFSIYDKKMRSCEHFLVDVCVMSYRSGRDLLGWRMTTSTRRWRLLRLSWLSSISPGRFIVDWYLFLPI